MNETRVRRFARQLRELLDRHGATAVSIEEQTAREGQAPVSAVTVRRILKAEARTEPQYSTLARIAEALGESYEAAFSEGGRYVFRRVGEGKKLTLELGRKFADTLGEIVIGQEMDAFIARLEHLSAERR